MHKNIYINVIPRR